MFIPPKQDFDGKNDLRYGQDNGDDIIEQRFSFIGKHVAVDFVNTKPLRNGVPVDLLADSSALEEWGRQAGLISAEAKVLITGSHKRALAVREAIRDCFERLEAGKPLGKAAIDTLNLALAAAPVARRIEPDGKGLALVESRSIANEDQLIAAIASYAAELLISPRASQLKHCRGDKCVLWFFDTSRNHSRQWCRMDRCGARAKSASFYRRRKEKGPADRSPGPSIRSKLTD